MNLREGTRRLALLLGVVGAIFGAFVSWAVLSNYDRQRVDHQRFEQLANSDLVKEAKHWIALTPERRKSELARLTPERKSQLAAALGFNGTETPSDTGEINKDGVKTIHWTTEHEVESLETADGQTLYPMSAPGVWSYVAVVALPLLGFFIPWCMVRAIGWVFSGFATRPK